MVKQKKSVNISNRLNYTLITFVIIVTLAIGVYALTPGTVPNPGHLITDVAPPFPCTTGQFLQFNGSTWVCNTTSGGTTNSGTNYWQQGSGSNIYYRGGYVGVNTTTPSFNLDVNGSLNAQSIYVNGALLPTPQKTPLQPLAHTDSSGNWIWTLVGTISHPYNTIGWSPIFYDTINLDPNRPVLGIAIDGSTDDFGYCAAGVPYSFFGVATRGLVLTSIQDNGNMVFSSSSDNTNAVYECTGSYQGTCVNMAGPFGIVKWFFNDKWSQSGNDNGIMSAGPYLGGQKCCTFGGGPSSTYISSNYGYNKALGLTYIREGLVLNVTSQVYNVVGTGGSTCNIYVLYGDYSVNRPSAQTQCTNSGGTWTNNVCQFNALLCPTNWVYAGWTTTTSNSCASDPCVGQTGFSCTTGSHGFANQPPESCQYKESYYLYGVPTCYYNAATCTATITQVGCLPA